LTSLISRRVLRISSTTLICSSETFIASAVARYCIDHGLPRSFCCSPGFLAGNARRLGDPGFFAGDARRLSGVAQPLLLLSDCLKRFAMMVPDLKGVEEGRQQEPTTFVAGIAA
jgi:hypothetical protein